MKKNILLIVLFFFSQTSFSKDVVTTGAQTFISLAKKISAYETLSFYHRDEFDFKNRKFVGREYPAGLVRTYFQLAYSYQFLPSITLAGGYIYQRRNPFMDSYENEQRIFQQLTFLHKYPQFNLTHRFRLEERFISKSGENEFKTRFRYQIGAKMPLRGLSIDPGEFYLNTFNEFYFSTSGKRNAFFSEDWFYLGSGYTTKDSGSFELGPVLQWTPVNEDKDTRWNLLVQFGWIYKFS